MRIVERERGKSEKEKEKEKEKIKENCASRNLFNRMTFYYSFFLSLSLSVSLCLSLSLSLCLSLSATLSVSLSLCHSPHCLFCRSISLIHTYIFSSSLSLSLSAFYDHLYNPIPLSPSLSLSMYNSICRLSEPSGLFISFSITLLFTSLFLIVLTMC
jgi:hypothetical protein